MRERIQALSSTHKSVLMFIAAILPPLIVLLNEKSQDPFLYGAAIAGGVLVFVVKQLSDE